MSRDHNAYVDAANSSASESSSGYDSEAAAPTKGSRTHRPGGRAHHAVKRRKTSPAPSSSSSSSEDVHYGQGGRFHRECDNVHAYRWDHDSRRPGLHPRAIQRLRLDGSLPPWVADAEGTAHGTRGEEAEGPNGEEGR